MVDESPKVARVGTSKKTKIEGNQAMDLFQVNNDRNGRHTLDLIHRLIWEREGQPLYRGVPRMMPFELKIDKVLWDFVNFIISVEYHFSDRRS